MDGDTNDDDSVEDGDDSDDVLQIIDQLENDFQEALIFGEEVAKTLLQLVMEYFHSEDYYYWLYGWLTGPHI